MKQIPLGFGKEYSAQITLVSAKRSSVERSGIHAWHPYYAGYSEAFVESALSFLECESESLILDPWGGSGTTGVVASRTGFTTVCLDVNPVMSAFTAAKSIEVVKQAESLNAFFAGLENSLPNADETAGEPLDNILHPNAAKTVRRIVKGVEASFTKTALAREVRLDNAVDEGLQFADPLYSFCLAVIFVSVRKLSKASNSANPTWLRTGEKHDISQEEVVREVQRNATSMLYDLRSFYSGHPEAVAIRAVNGDVRDMSIKPESIDYVITSPPYLTRIDYAMSTMPELYVFGDEDLITSIRHQTMGAPVITKMGKVQREEWGPLTNQILDTIKNHPTKASGSYYWKNIVQYFMDMDGALDEIMRVLKPGASGLVVVQSSYFKELELPLGEIYVEVASRKGFNARIAFREEIKGHMAHVNTRSNVYKKNKVYYEDFVFIEKQ